MKTNWHFSNCELLEKNQFSDWKQNKKKLLKSFQTPSSRPVVPQGVSPAGRPPQLQAQNQQQVNLQQQLNAQNANQLQQNRQRQAISEFFFVVLI